MKTLTILLCQLMIAGAVGCGPPGAAEPTRAGGHPVGAVETDLGEGRVSARIELAANRLTPPEILTGNLKLAVEGQGYHVVEILWIDGDGSTADADRVVINASFGDQEFGLEFRMHDDSHLSAGFNVPEQWAVVALVDGVKADEQVFVVE